MTGATFSVIVPTYNRARLVQRTLRTVINQRYPAHEIIVVDNCSTDETAAALRPLADQGQILFIQHERNLERAASRNTGMAHATGDFVTFLDSDDLMYPDNLADAAAFVRRYPAVGLFHNLFEYVDSDGRLVRRVRAPSLTDPVRAIAEGNFMSCIGNFLRRDLYTDLRFDIDARISGSEDWHFWLSAIPRTKVGRIRKVNSGVVQHDARTVSQVDLPALHRRLAVLIDKVLTDPSLSGTYVSHRARIEASGFLFLASAANTAGDPRSARRFTGNAARVSLASLISEKALRIVAHTLIESAPQLIHR